MLAKSIPQIGHQILQSTAMPIVIPSSGSIAANGAVTLTTALPNTYPDIYLYFPTNKPVIPASPTPIVAAGPGAYTQSTSEITAVSVNIVGGSMGKNGIVKQEATVFALNNANSKTVKWKFGGVLINSIDIASTNRALGRNAVVNRGRVDRQAISNVVDALDPTAPLTYSIDTNIDRALVVTLQRFASADYLGVDYYFTELLPRK